MITRLILTTAFALLPSVSSLAQKRATPKIPTHFWGTWRVYKRAEVGGHAEEKPEKAAEEIGRRVKLGRRTFSHDRGLFFYDPPCRRPRYTFEVRRYGPGDKGALAHYDLSEYGQGEARYGWVQSVIVRCGNEKEYYFELAKGKQLAVYYDGWWFFLKKARG